METEKKTPEEEKKPDAPVAEQKDEPKPEEKPDESKAEDKKDDKPEEKADKPESEPVPAVPDAKDEEILRLKMSISVL